MHGFPDGCAALSAVPATTTTQTTSRLTEGDVATAHVRETTEDDVRAGRVVDFGVFARRSSFFITFCVR